MNPSALVFWLLSWGVIAGVTVWCFWKLLSGDSDVSRED